MDEFVHGECMVAVGIWNKGDAWDPFFKKVRIGVRGIGIVYHTLYQIYRESTTSSDIAEGDLGGIEVGAGEEGEVEMCSLNMSVWS